MRALLLVDLQNDFMPGGALPVGKGFEILSAVNRLLICQFDAIVATKDWHPKDHGSFAVNQGKLVGEHIILDGLDQILWPVHCVQDTFGAEFALGWDNSKVDHIIYKGTEKNIDSYSCFFDNGHRKATGLYDFLKNKKIKNLVIAGLAADYCVKYTVFDALELGFEVFVAVDGCKGVDLSANDSEKSFEEMKQAGAKLCSSEEIALSFLVSEEPGR